MNLVTSFIWFWTRFNYRNNFNNLSLKVSKQGGRRRTSEIPIPPLYHGIEISFIKREDNPIREEDHKWVMQISKRIYLEKNQKV
jgi:hypothetical protein